MRFLFFDMEFANGQIPGSIYSIGYLMTDESFQVLLPLRDELINPDCVWNEYVEQNILAYPKEEVEKAPAFPERYASLKALFEQADVAVGFAVSNDTRALKRACERYDLPPIVLKSFDVERLCRMMEEHKEAHGLGGYVRAWCGEEPDHRHRSDGDAYATMLLLRAICEHLHVDAEMMVKAYPECVGEHREAKPLPHKRKRRGRGKSKK